MKLQSLKFDVLYKLCIFYLVLSSLKNKVCDPIRVKLLYVTKISKNFTIKLPLTRIFLANSVHFSQGHKEEICSN